MKFAQTRHRFGSAFVFLVLVGCLAVSPALASPGEQGAGNRAQEPGDEPDSGPRVGVGSEGGFVEAPRDTVTFAWPLAADHDLDFVPRVETQRSKEYWLDVTAAQLAAGLGLDLTAPRAVVRVNPMPGTLGTGSPALDGLDLEIVDARGVRYGLGTGMEALATAEQLAASGIPLVAGTTAFRLRPEVGAGRVTLQAPKLGESSGTFVVHVFEPESSTAATLATGRGSYLAGHDLNLYLGLEAAGVAAAQRAQGVVLSPGGQRFVVDFQADGDGSYRASLPLVADASPAPGLWEVEAMLTGRTDAGVFRRNVRTAFAVAYPSARLTGRAVVTGDGALIGDRVLGTDGVLLGGGVLVGDSVLRGSGVLMGDGVLIGDSPHEQLSKLIVRLDLEASLAGRYELRAVLFGTDDKGELRPMGVANTASWLEPGEGSIKLRFGPEVLGGSTLRAPYVVRDLRLMDQGRLGLLYQQLEALRIGR